MLDFSFGELALIGLVALLVVGPKDFPIVMRTLGQWFGRFKSLSDEFREGFRSAIGQGHLAEMERDLNVIHREIEYIRDQNGHLQRTYDVSHFMEERDPAPTRPPGPPAA